MNKKILVISGSARRGGNSDLLCDQFIKGAEESGNKTEKIRLAEKKIKDCIGCMSCKRNEAKCVLDDDMPLIAEKILASDVLVIASPVYYYAVNGLVKIFIDRTFCRFTDMKDKELYYILTCTDNSDEAINAALRDLHSFAHCLPGSKEKGTVYGYGNREKGEVRNKPAMQEAYRMGLSV